MRAFKALPFVVLAAFLTMLGCESQVSWTSSPSTTSQSDGDADIDKVFEQHNVEVEELTLNKDEVVQRLGDAQKWTEFSIDEIGPGQYEGQAKSPTGQLLNVEVRQTANGIYSRYTNADDSGSGKACIVW